MSGMRNLTVDEFALLVDQKVADKIKELGLDRVDRKHAIFPGVDEDLDRKERVNKFFRAVFGGDELTAKALSEGTDAAGGYLVPDEFRAEVVVRLPEISELAPFVRPLSVGSDAGRLPKLATDIGMSWDEAENAAFDESDPVFDQLTFSIHRMNAICKTSRELMGDSNPNVVELLTQLFTEAVAAERDRVIAVGDGSTQPEGIYSASGLSSVAVGGSITFPKLVEIEHTLAKKYRRNARWVMNNTNVQRLQSLVDQNDQPIFQRNVADKSPATLLGYPLSQQDNLPDTYVFFGDLQRYLWFDREQLGIEVTNTGGDAFAKHQTWIKVWERVDGKLSLAEAFVYGNGITG